MNSHKHPRPYFECRLRTLSQTCWCENKLKIAPDLSVITRRVFQSLKNLPTLKPWESLSKNERAHLEPMWHVFAPHRSWNEIKTSAGGRRGKRSYFRFDETICWRLLNGDLAASVCCFYPKPGHVLGECLNRLRKEKNKLSDTHTGPREGQDDFPKKTTPWRLSLINPRTLWICLSQGRIKQVCLKASQKW